MSRPCRVLVLGTGQMGAGIIRSLLEKRDLVLVGAYGRRRERAGRDVGRAIGLARPLGLEIAADLPALVESARPDIAIQATCSRLADALPEVNELVRRGVHVISIAEEMAWPAARSPEQARELDALARAHGVGVLGTGVNPGFVLDLLPVVLSGACTHVERIEAVRVNDLSPYGPTVLASQGVGLTPEAFRAGVASGAVTGHFGFPQSIAMIASALDWEIERVEERREPIVSGVARETPFARVRPGEVAGCHHSAVAYAAGRPVISLDHPQQIRPELAGIATGDTLAIHGAPGIRLSGSPEIPGGAATIALAVNAIPRVLAAAPGLHAMVDLPPPASLPCAGRALPAVPQAGRAAR